MRQLPPDWVLAGALGALDLGTGQRAFAGAGAPGSGEVPALFGCLADRVPFGPVAVEVGDAPVAADQLHHDVDVVVALGAEPVVHGDPTAATAALFVGAEAEPVHRLLDHLPPALIAEQPVLSRDRQRHVIDVPTRHVDLMQHPRRVQGGDQLRAPLGRGQRRDQRWVVEPGGVPGGDQVRVGVLVVPAGAEQVVDRACDVVAPDDLPNHLEPSSWSSSLVS